MKPLFVVFEGIDRCGKTEQAELLRQRLVSLGVPTESVGTPDRRMRTGQLAGDLLRGSLRFSGGDSSDESLALQCVLTCNRYEVAWKVSRYLCAETSVVCVRWWPSVIAYGEEDDLDVEPLRRAASFLPEPDLMLFLDVEPEVVSHRHDPRERYEASLDTQERVAHTYRSLWRERSGLLPSKWVAVDGSGTPDVVAERVWGLVCQSREELRHAREVAHAQTVQYGKEKP